MAIINKEDKETCLHEFILDYLDYFSKKDPILRFMTGYAKNVNFRYREPEELQKLQKLSDYAKKVCDSLSRPCKRDSRDIILESESERQHKEAATKIQETVKESNIYNGHSRLPLILPLPLPLPEKNLYSSAVEIEALSSGQEIYRCKIHPDIWKTDWEQIEGHCKNEHD